MSTRKKVILTVLATLLLVGAYSIRQHLPGFTTVEENQILVVTDTIRGTDVEQVLAWYEGPDIIFTSWFSTYLYLKTRSVHWEATGRFKDGTKSRVEGEVILKIDPSQIRNIHRRLGGAEILDRRTVASARTAIMDLTAQYEMMKFFQIAPHEDRISFPAKETLEAIDQQVEKDLIPGVRLWMVSVVTFDPDMDLLRLLQLEGESPFEPDPAINSVLSAKRLHLSASGKIKD